MIRASLLFASVIGISASGLSQAETVSQATLGALAQKPGLTGADLLLTDTPRTNSATTEQQIRGKDGAADWIVLLSGYDGDVIEDAIAGQLSPAALGALGAQNNPTTGHYRLAFTMTPQDVATI